MLHSLTIAIKSSLEIVSNVGTRTKSASRSRENDGPHLRIVVAQGDCLNELSIHPLGPCIEPFGTVQRNDGNVVFFLKCYLLKLHKKTPAQLFEMVSMRQHPRKSREIVAQGQDQDLVSSFFWLCCLGFLRLR